MILRKMKDKSLTIKLFTTTIVLLLALCGIAQPPPGGFPGGGRPPGGFPGRPPGDRGDWNQG